MSNEKQLTPIADLISRMSARRDVLILKRDNPHCSREYAVCETRIQELDACISDAESLLPKEKESYIQFADDYLNADSVRYASDLFNETFKTESDEQA